MSAVYKLEALKNPASYLYLHEAEKVLDFSISLNTTAVNKMSCIGFVGFCHPPFTILFSPLPFVATWAIVKSRLNALSFTNVKLQESVCHRRSFRFFAGQERDL